MKRVVTREVGGERRFAATALRVEDDNFVESVSIGEYEHIAIGPSRAALNIRLNETVGKELSALLCRLN